MKPSSMHPVARALWLEGFDLSFEFGSIAEARAAIAAALAAHPDLAAAAETAPAWNLEEVA